MTAPTESGELKSCACAAVYQSDFARLLLGDSFSIRVGNGSITAAWRESWGLAPVFAYSTRPAVRARKRHFRCPAVRLPCQSAWTSARRMWGRPTRGGATSGAGSVTSRFIRRRGLPSALNFPDASFDAVLCECAFCTFPDKRAAASEFARVLRAGGRVGMSDLTRAGALPQELDGMLAWIACIADARPVAEYAGYLAAAGFEGEQRGESHDEALAEMARDIQGRLLGIQIMVGLKKLDLPGADFEQAKQLARAAAKAIQEGLLGYSLVVAELRAGESACF